jgi:hypothetical protein
VDPDEDFVLSVRCGYRIGPPCCHLRPAR